MGQCVPKTKSKPKLEQQNKLTQTLLQTNYAIVDKNMLPKDLVGTINNPTYIFQPQNQQQQQQQQHQQQQPPPLPPKISINDSNLKGSSRNNLNKDKCDSSVYNYIDYEYETVLNNKYKNDQNYKNKNIYKTISIDIDDTKKNDVINIEKKNYNKNNSDSGNDDNNEDDDDDDDDDDIDDDNDENEDDDYDDNYMVSFKNSQKLSKLNINTYRGKKHIETNSIIEMTSL